LAYTTSDKLLLFFLVTICAVGSRHRYGVSGLFHGLSNGIAVLIQCTECDISHAETSKPIELSFVMLDGCAYWKIWLNDRA